MIDFIEYVVSELKSKRLSKTNALSLIRQFRRHSSAAVDSGALHPLLHRNTSDLTQQSYGSRFDGEEFFLRDHRVQGRKVLPGVAYLEMARAAVSHALPDRPEAAVLELRNVVWAQPIVVDEPKEIALALFVEDEPGAAGERIGFEIYSPEENEVIHCQGQALFSATTAPAKRDIGALREQVSRSALDASVLYPAMAEAGIEIGPSHRGVRTVHRGDQQLLVEIVLPEAVDGTLGEYVLHPSVMDSAVQAAMALVVDPVERAGRPPLPFALESLRVFSGCAKEMVAWVRYSPGCRHDDKVIKLDIDLCDIEGRVCAQLMGFSSRVPSADIEASGAEVSPAAARAHGARADGAESADGAEPEAHRTEAPLREPGTLFAAPDWEPSSATLSVSDDAAGTEQHVVLCDLPAVDAAELQARLGLQGPCLRIGNAPQDDLAGAYSAAALSCFESIQTILKSKPRGKVLIQIVAPDAPEGLLFAGLSGLLRTAARENPQLAGQIVFTRQDIGADELASQLRQEARSALDPVVRYANGERYVRRWTDLDESQASPDPARPAFKDDGVYLVTGGLGGLGVLFAREILGRTKSARVVLTGRSPLTADRQAIVDAFAAGPRVLYRQVDLSDAGQVTRLIADLIRELGRLDGILHSAGKVEDNFILKKSAAEFRGVLQPKVTGTVLLDRATADVELDFLALFSSVSAVFGNPGQADYTAANGFMDAFAGLRNRWVAAKQRRGITVSINWPLWQEGGMRLAPANEQMLRQATGMWPMRTSTGMQAFHRSLAARRDQVLVVEGEPERMRDALLTKQEAGQTAGPAGARSDRQHVEPVSPPPSAASLQEKTQDYLRKQFSVVLKLAPHRIDPQAPLEHYGIDSIVAMELTSQLEIAFGSLPKTLFFEYQTIRELADYFIREYPAKLSGLFTDADERDGERNSARSRIQASSKPRNPSTGGALGTAGTRARRRRRRMSGGHARSAEPIAIVGLSGRYPQSVDLDAYWRNLRDGKDCITEVPKERWDWREYFSEDRTAEGAHYSKFGGFIAGVDEFDPLFFNIPPVDAELIDPQERLFLQHAWMAIEDAGYTRASLRAPHDQDLAGQVGVYVGVMYGEYQLFGAEASLQGRRIGLPVSYASIANRVSYFLNLHGPSMALDTMCSSSLTAIHLACQDLKQGRTSLAIAGGVNVSIHPNKYLILSSGQYISSDGHCQSFGVGGDGYIPGEGVGVVVLKRLSDAERDGNHIYGLIKGSALNHGGKTNGYTVPNLPAQAAVIGRALRECNVDARHISYVEAHGTGTKLGDPIEIAALTQAFRQFTQDNGFCRVGSAKSNIGHCESAAGIAGLTKVLLQMKHRQVVPSLHSSTLNPHIDFEKSPFVVNQSLRDWDPPEVDGRRLPRIAGISSFGAGGSNAHLIVEEYSPARVEPEDDRSPRIFPLSARTAEQLKQKARDLLAFIRGQESPPDLSSMAYTLQAGREAMEVRAGFVARTAAQLAEKLEAYARGEPHIEDVFQGRAVKDNGGIAALGQDEDMAEAIDRWIARGKHSKLLDLWVKGLEIDWRKLYGERKPRFCSLPTYPFAKERYWIASAARGKEAVRSAAAALHPLVHTNTSDLHQQSYAAVFTGEEPFVADHRIRTRDGGQAKVLPGVACLEMARAAADLALPASEPRALELRNIAWAQPLIVDGEKRISISLLANDANGVDFEVSTQEGTQDPAVHCQGFVAPCAQSGPGRHDIGALKARMTRGHLTPEEIYGAFEAMGIHYGPSFRCLTLLHRGNGELLAELSLDDPAGRQLSGCLLHPGLADSALQASIGLVEELDSLPRQPSIPFALDCLKVFSPCAPRMFAWVRRSPGSEPGSDSARIDVDLCDQDGAICAQLVGLTSRTLAEPERKAGCLIALPSWETSLLDVAAPEAAANDPRRVVVLCDLPHLDAEKLAALLPGSEVRPLALARAASIAERYREAASACLAELQSLLKDGPAEKVLFQVAVGGTGESALLAGLSGLIRTARLENPNLVGQVVLSDATADEPMLARHLRAAQLRSDEALLKYERDRQAVLRWQLEELRGATHIAFRKQGVYIITGGLGGLGSAFAAEILKRAEGARVVLTGRSELTAEKQSAMAKLTSDASVPSDRLVYRKLDLTQLDAVERLVADVVRDFGGIHGVIHSAGMIQDSFIIHKTQDELGAVLAPKVAGAFNLDRATRDVDLDFLVFFSSVSAVLGNAGQADYAAANGFLDQLASYRNDLVKLGRRRGRTLSIDWPLWEEGGMRPGPEVRELLAKTAGIVPMTTETGMRAFHRSLELQAERTLIVEGDVDRLRRLLVSKEPTPAAANAQAGAAHDPTDADASELLVKTQSYLSGQLASLLRLPAHEVDPKAPLEKYGIDSVLAMKLTSQLEQTFGSLSKTLFFEHRTIASLAGYLAKAFPRIVQEKTGVQAGGARSGAQAQPSRIAQAPPPQIRSAVSRSIRSGARFVRSGEPARPRDVAIIGVSGRYPLAATLDEFWENLRNGRDCITEIPADRWDHGPLYHPERNQAGKCYSKWGGFLSEVDRFDPLFFGISPREAELIDPQERLFLETVWETIEDAGYSKDAIARSRVGVFVGVMWGQYELFGAAPGRSGIPNSSFASIANRVSYFFDFRGPSLALDTMCSSSLTAIHLASEEIRKGGVDVAIAGGVNVSIHPNKYLNLSQGNFASTDGRCRSFGAGGDGYVPGEGVGAVLLKSLDQAIADGDRIYAVVKASSINHGGKTNGYTVPNPLAQSEVIVEALRQARIDPMTLGYIETHGTGTSLGDPIEIAGLAQAFDSAEQAGAARGTQSCPIGSVKSNIGHLESAAGIAAVTKVLLQLKHRQLVPSLHAEPANPNIDFATTPFRVQTRLEEWKRPAGHPRRAGVSSFGAGGANAHLVLEEFINPSEPVFAPVRPEAFVLSAKSRERLVAYAEKMLAFLLRSPDVPLADIAYTSQVGRTAMQERLVVIASSREMLYDKLSKWLQATQGQPRESRRGPVHAVEDVYDGSLKDSRSSAAALLEGEAGQAFMRLTLEKRDLAKLAQLWVAGVEVDWAALHAANRPRKVSLPTYPFARQRYWIASDIDMRASAHGNPAASGESVEPGERRELLYYRPEWRAAEAGSANEARGSGPLLILDADDTLFAALKAENESVTILVKPGEAFRQIEPDVFAVSWESEAEVLRLVEALQARGSLPRAIVHHDTGGLQQGIYALHGLCKSLMKRKLEHRVRIVSVRAGCADEHSAMHAALGGYFKTLTLENPKFLGKVVAIRGDASTRQLAGLVRVELDEAAWQSCEVRYLDAHQGGRRIKVLERHVPRETAAAGAGLKQGGVYLVTGGLGGLGYLFSEHLAKHYQARLVLIGRSEPDAEQRRKLARLASYGREPLYRQADVTDAAQVAAVVREVKEKLSRLDGIIHSAGVHRDSFILNKTPEEIRSVLAAKVAGTIHLDRATRDEPPDLFVLFSSVAGALGNPGQSDYAYANSFLDAFAEQRQASVPGRTLSIDWPFWEEGGMRLSQGSIELTEQHTGIAPLPTEKGIRCFETLLQSECSQAIAVHGVASKIDAYVLRNRVREVGSPARTSANPAVPHSSGANPSAERSVTAQRADLGALTDSTVRYLQTLIGGETKLPPEQVDPQERFESFGIDSMMISRMNAALERDFGELPKTLFYEHATVEELAAYLVRDARASLVRYFNPAPAPETVDVQAAPAAASVSARQQPLEPETASFVASVSTRQQPLQRDAVPAAEPIAIIGIHGCFPQSEGLDEYWEHLKAGRDLIEPVPASRWDLHEFFDADPEKAKEGKIYCASGGFLADFDKFDAEFFQISREDARLMDPQERLFLQSAWAAIEDAGYTRESLRKHFPKAKSADVGVFAGVTTNTYHLLAPEEWSRGNMVTPGALPWSIANRVSYFFDFQGPSMPVDTACSSSLVALHLACESLRRGECQVAIAGGVNLYLHPSKYQSFCRRRMLALDGRCRSFGAGDDGFIPGEGVGTLVLKPLSKAIEHRDHIHGLIVASACEHSGRSNGYSAPNPNSQANLIAHTLSQAGIHPETIGYIEGHGTGTQLGDSLEIVSLTQAFRRYTDRRQFCPIGSVKANIGHSESAAGVAGVAKVLLQMKHGQIAPTIHSDTVNPNIDFESSPFYLQRALAPWSAGDDRPRRAMINAFGAGGVNSCVILEEYRRAPESVGTHKGPYLIVLSARTGAALRDAALRLKSFLSREREVDMARLAYTLQVGREAMSERLAVAVSDAAELLRELENYCAGSASEKIAHGRVEARRARKSARQNERESAGAPHAGGALEELARKWVQGQEIEWEALYAGERPVRLPLPTYPFARVRHWVSDAPAGEKRGALRQSVAQLHPLVTANLSTLRETAFGSVLSAEPFYARDHKVDGEVFFPGAGFLEIAGISGTIAGEAKVTAIRDIVWSRPLKLSTTDRLVKTFLKANGDATEYVIVSFDEDNERIVHSEGRLFYGAQEVHGAQGRAPRTIQSLKAGCSRTIDGAECYRTFERHGLQYGPAFRTIEELHVGDGFAISKLKLSDALQAEFEQYILHPCLIDGALQTVIGLAGEGGADSPYLPFALDEVEILRPLPPTCYAHAELAASPGASRSDIKQFNIGLLNENGDVLLRLNRFYVRALRGPGGGRHGDSTRALAAE